MEIPRILIAYLLIALAIALCVTGARAVGNSQSPQSPFASYLGERGIAITPEIHFDMARFYQDILKVQAKKEVIEACDSSGNFSDCINKTYSQDPDMQTQYEGQMQQIRDAVDIGKQYGIQYRSVPFIRDLIG